MCTYVLQETGATLNDRCSTLHRIAENGRKLQEKIILAFARCHNEVNICFLRSHISAKLLLCKHLIFAADCRTFLQTHKVSPMLQDYSKSKALDSSSDVLQSASSLSFCNSYLHRDRGCLMELASCTRVNAEGILKFMNLKRCTHHT